LRDERECMCIGLSVVRERERERERESLHSTHPHTPTSGGSGYRDTWTVHATHKEAHESQRIRPSGRV